MNYKYGLYAAVIVIIIAVVVFYYNRSSDNKTSHPPPKREVYPVVLSNRKNMPITQKQINDLENHFNASVATTEQVLDAHKRGARSIYRTIVDSSHDTNPSYDIMHLGDKINKFKSSVIKPRGVLLYGVKQQLKSNKLHKWFALDGTGYDIRPFNSESYHDPQLQNK